MEYGSITIIGLPADWRILIDASLIKKPRVAMGSGLLRSKLSVRGATLSELPNAEVIEGLGIRS